MAPWVAPVGIDATLAEQGADYLYHGELGERVIEEMERGEESLRTKVYAVSSTETLARWRAIKSATA